MTTPVLPPLRWQPIPITPLPEVLEDNSEFSWRLFDAAVRAAEKWVAQQPDPTGKKQP